jgi:hypothetical protein
MSRAISPKRFYYTGGAVSADAPSYVQRQADQELLEHAAAGDFCYVLTPRQMGKSSLVTRTVAQLKKRRMHSVVIDLQGKIERGMAPDAFFAGLISECIRQLKLPIQLEQWWQEHALLSAVQRFTNFVADEVLLRVRKRLVVFIDQIDSTLSLDFSDDFFAAVRAFYNERARDAAFQRLTFVLLGVAAPQDLIKHRARSPFNIGHRIEPKEGDPHPGGSAGTLPPCPSNRRGRSLPETGAGWMAVFKKQGVYWDDYYVSGRRKRERIGPDKKLADTVLKKRKVAIAEGGYLEKQRPVTTTFDELAAAHLRYARGTSDLGDGMWRACASWTSSSADSA